MKRYYFIIGKDGTLVETKTKVDTTGLDEQACELTLLHNSDIVVREENKTKAKMLIDTEYLGLIHHKER